MDIVSALANASNNPDRSVAARWTPRLAEAGFTPISRVFLENYAKLTPHPGAKGLNATEAMFVIQLMTYKWDARAPFPTTNTLAERMGLTQRYIREMAKKLEELGLLRRIRPSRSSANRWDLTPLFKRLEELLDAEQRAEADDVDDAPAAEAA